MAVEKIIVDTLDTEDMERIEEYLNTSPNQPSYTDLSGHGKYIDVFFIRGSFGVSADPPPKRYDKVVFSIKSPGLIMAQQGKDEEKVPKKIITERNKVIKGLMKLLGEIAIETE